MADIFNQEIQNVDPRLIETLASNPSVASRLGVQGTQRMFQYVRGEREKSSWLRGGNIILDTTKEWVSKEDWNKLDRVEQELLKKVGTKRFNEIVSNSLRIGNKWYGSGTPIFKVFSLIKEGVTTYEEVEKKTGLSREQIDDFIQELVRGKYLETTGGGTAAPSTPTKSTSTITSTRGSGSYPRPSGGHPGSHPRSRTSRGRMAGGLSIRGGIYTK